MSADVSVFAAQIAAGSPFHSSSSSPFAGQGAASIARRIAGQQQGQQQWPFGGACELLCTSWSGSGARTGSINGQASQQLQQQLSCKEVQLLQLTNSDTAEAEQSAAAGETADRRHAGSAATTLPYVKMTSGSSSCDVTSCVVSVSQAGDKEKQPREEGRIVQSSDTAAAEAEVKTGAANSTVCNAANGVTNETLECTAASLAVGTAAAETATAGAAGGAEGFAAAGIPLPSPHGLQVPAQLPLLCQLSNSSLASAPSSRAAAAGLGVDAASALAAAGAAAGYGSGRFSAVPVAAAAAGAQTSELVREMAVMKKLDHPNVVALHEVGVGPSCGQQYAYLGAAS